VYVSIAKSWVIHTPKVKMFILPQRLLRTLRNFKLAVDTNHGSLHVSCRSMCCLYGSKTGQTATVVVNGGASICTQFFLGVGAPFTIEYIGPRQNENDEKIYWSNYFSRRLCFSNRVRVFLIDWYSDLTEESKLALTLNQTGKGHGKSSMLMVRSVHMGRCDFEK
jgi:hypothetical protein